MPLACPRAGWTCLQGRALTPPSDGDGARSRQAAQVDVEDIKRVYTLFLDQTRSARYLEQFQDQYLGSAPDAGSAAAAMDV